MTAIHLHDNKHVGTTYKRALLENFSGGTGRCQTVPAALLHGGRVHLIIVASNRNGDCAMRKPRDFDSELKALADKARQLKERRVRQLGELVTATGADTLDADLLAGALLHAATMKDAATKEGWRKAGAAFFQTAKRRAAGGPAREPSGTLPLDGGATSA